MIPSEVPPPPDAPKNLNDYNVLSSDSEEETDIRNEETPLIRHSSRKSEPVFRNKRAPLPTVYSTVSDYTGGADEGSWSDGPPTNEYYDDDDDRSLSAQSVASLTSLSTVALENFREGLATPFTDDEGTYDKIIGGLGSLCIVGTVLGLVMPKNEGLHGELYRVISSVIGYNYFVLWSICFYPQVLLNYRRKSTRGLSNDFAILNFMGWTFYSAYVASMYYADDIKSMYEQRFSNESSTVQSNDVAFSVHAMIMSFIYLVQIVYYGGKGFSFPLKPQTWVLVLGMGIPAFLVPVLIKTGVLEYSRWLDYFYVLSFFKICCTLTKYSKQVMLNYKRKSTSGWNIWYNFLECSGGSLSMLQICLDSYDMHDITGITGNMAKFALGFATIFFDGIFFTQHYVLYAKNDDNADKQPSDDDLATNIPVMIRTNSRLDLSRHTIESEGV